MQKGLVLKGLSFAVITALVVVTASWIPRICFMPIEVVALTDDLQYEDPELIRDTVSPVVQSGFFAFAVRDVRERLEGLPWIDKADVVRKWPNRVQISLTEYQPLAIWEDSGIIDKNGRLFFPTNLANIHDLPRFTGDKDRVNDMVGVFSLLMSGIKPLGLKVERLSLTQVKGWQALLDNGITVILGQHELEERMHRFVLAYTGKLGSDAKNISVIDLRYTNGLSVG